MDAPSGATLVVLLSLAFHVTNGEIKEHPTISGRYSDSFSINALAGNDAEFNYTFPPEVLPLLSITFDEVGGRFLGYCYPDSQKEQCNPPTNYVKFVKHPNSPYIVMPNVTVNDSGLYQIRATRRDDKSIDPNHIDVFVNFKVFEERELDWVLEVPNVFRSDAFNPIREPNFFETSYPLEAGHQYAVFIHFDIKGPPANVTATQFIGARELNFTRTSATKSWSQLIRFNKSSIDESWRVRVIVAFDVQDVSEAVVEFTVHQAEPHETSTALIPAIVVSVAMGLCIVFVLSGWFYLKNQTSKIPDYKELANWSIMQDSNISTSDELCVAEYVYKVRVPRRGSSKALYQKSILDVTKLITAMANTCGGIILCNFEGNIGANMKQWKKDCELSFTKYSKMQYNSIVSDCRKSERLAFFVKKSQELIPLYPGINKRYDKSEILDRLNKPGHYENIVNRVKAYVRQALSKVIPERHDFFFTDNLEELLGDHDSETNKTVLQAKISQYANSQSGGIIIFATALDDVKKYEGFKTIPDENTLDQLLGKLYSDAADKNNQFGRWSYELTPMMGDSEKSVILYYINGAAIAYGIKDDGVVERLQTKDLDNRSELMRKPTLLVLDTKPDDNTSDVERGNCTDHATDQTDESTALLQNENVITTTQRSPDETKRRNEWYRQSAMMRKATTNAIQQQVLSWSSNSFAWIADAKINPRHTNIQMFTLTEPVNFIPSKHTIATFAVSDESVRIIHELDFNGKGCVILLQTSGEFIALLLIREGGIFELRCINAKTELGKKSPECGSVQELSSIYQIGRRLKRNVCMKLEEQKYFQSTHSKEPLSFNIKTDSNQKNKEVWINEELTKLSMPKPDTIKALNQALYSVIATNYNAVRHRLGDQQLMELGKKHAKFLLESEESVHFVEGPPGSGKSLMALTVHKHETLKNKNVLYCCPTECFKAMLKSKTVLHAMCVGDDKGLETLLIYLNDYDVIIFDDIQRIQSNDFAKWKSIFENISQNNKKLYMFADSYYQNYHSPDRVNHIRKELKDVYGTYEEHKLTEIHRNSKKVFSFIKENLENQLAKPISCHHDVNGDDVLFCHLTDTDADNENNGLVKLVKSVLGIPVDGRAYEHDVHYNKTEIALIVGGNDAERCRDSLKARFDRFLPDANAQDAEKHPVEGMIIETADNFCGLDSQVCIFYPGDTISDNTNIENVRYKTYIASRGINLVIFVEKSETLTLQQLESMHMGNLSKNIIDTYSHWNNFDIEITLECVQHAEVNEDILSGLSAITAKYGDEAVAQDVVKFKGVDYALRQITKRQRGHADDISHDQSVDETRDKEIRERALMTFTSVALHKDTLPGVMRNDVIQTACESLKSEWDPEWWEAAYLLGHMLHKGGEAWKGRTPKKDVVVENVDECIKAQEHSWVYQRESAVAHGKVDYATYLAWIEQKDIPVLHLLAILSLANLIFTEGGNECPNLQKYIGIEEIAKIIGDTEYDSEVWTMASDIVKQFDEQKIVQGAFKRYY